MSQCPICHTGGVVCLGTWSYHHRNSQGNTRSISHLITVNCCILSPQVLSPDQTPIESIIFIVINHDHDDNDDHHHHDYHDHDHHFHHHHHHCHCCCHHYHHFYQHKLLCIVSLPPIPLTTRIHLVATAKSLKQNMVYLNVEE